MSTPTILKRIIERKREEVAERKVKQSPEVIKENLNHASPTRGFVSSIETKLMAGKPAVIAELKKASPSKGIIRQNFAPAAIASSYEQAGAACLSVLTDIDFFQGQDSYLTEARNACNLPVIRKDFIVDDYQIYESRVLGADCILLIAAALSPEQLIQYDSLARKTGLDVLVEVHNATELAHALRLTTPLIGINNRNLHNFEVSLNTTLALLESIPDDRIVVTESGIHSRDDVTTMRAKNVNTFLVGESFMRAENPGDKLKELFF